MYNLSATLRSDDLGNLSECISKSTGTYLSHKTRSDGPLI